MLIKFAAYSLSLFPVNVGSVIYYPSEFDVNESRNRETDDVSSSFPPSTQNQELCDPSVKQVYGYFDAGNERKLFFWFFESRSNPSQDPIILWLDGGPGCSSMNGLFLEVGPCTVNADGTDTELNPYSWNAQSNLLFVDQPAGAGFSEGSPVTNGSLEAADDLYLALQQFFSNHVQFRTNDLYIAGVSYAGHFIPATAHKIWRENVRGVEPYIPLRGIAIGNGWMNAAVQLQLRVLHYPQMAHHSCTAPRVIGGKEYSDLKTEMEGCSNAISRCLSRNVSACTEAYSCWLEALAPLQARGINLHDMRAKYKAGFCSAADGENVVHFLNSDRVQKKLGVKKRFVQWSQVGNFSFDRIAPFDMLLPDLLDAEIKVLVYAGDQDYVCNWIGYERVIEQMKWAGQEAFIKAPQFEYKDNNGTSLGLLKKLQWKENGMLGFLQIYLAGHYVPTDQPQAALFMVNDFIHGTLGQASAEGNSSRVDMDNAEL